MHHVHRPAAEVGATACIPEAEEGAWQDPEFLKAFEAKGESVEVNDSDRKNVNLVVIRDPVDTPKP